MPFEETKMLEFKQYQKFGKKNTDIYADLECIIERIDGCKIILKIHIQQRQANTFYQIFQRLQYLHLEVQKVRTIYTEVKIV